MKSWVVVSSIIFVFAISGCSDEPVSGEESATDHIDGTELEDRVPDPIEPEDPQCDPLSDPGCKPPAEESIPEPCLLSACPIGYEPDLENCTCVETS